MSVHRVLHVWHFFWVLQFNKYAFLKEGQGLNKACGGFVIGARLVLPTDVWQSLLWGWEGRGLSEWCWEGGSMHDK